MAVEVKAENQSRVSVAWQPPRRSGRSPLWFIVEWVSTAQYGQEERYSWKRVPHQETHTYIQGEVFWEPWCYLVQFIGIYKAKIFSEGNVWFEMEPLPVCFWRVGPGREEE